MRSGATFIWVLIPALALASCVSWRLFNISRPQFLCLKMGDNNGTYVTEFS